MRGFAARQVAFSGVMLNALFAFGVADAFEFGAVAMIEAVFEHGRWFLGIYGFMGRIFGGYRP